MELKVRRRREGLRTMPMYTADDIRAWENKYGDRAEENSKILRKHLGCTDGRKPEEVRTRATVAGWCGYVSAANGIIFNGSMILDLMRDIDGQDNPYEVAAAIMSEFVEKTTKIKQQIGITPTPKHPSDN